MSNLTPTITEPDRKSLIEGNVVAFYIPETDQAVAVIVTATEVRAFVRYKREAIPDLADTILIGKVEKHARKN